MAAVAGTFGGTGGGGGGVALSVVIEEGVIAANFNDTSWAFPINTCVASGGTAPYSYVWSYVSTSGGSWNFAGSGTTATEAPVVTSVPMGAGVDAVLICTVTDSAGSPAVVASNQAYYYYENIA